MEKIELVAVYGSLRKGFHNSHYLEGCKCLGEFDTNPIYDLYAVCSSFPGLIEKGNTSIRMEVYSTSNKVREQIDRLEGYDADNKDKNHYNKIVIDTPFGKAFTYIYNHSTVRFPKIESGDWKLHKENIKSYIM